MLSLYEISMHAIFFVPKKKICHQYISALETYCFVSDRLGVVSVGAFCFAV